MDPKTKELVEEAERRHAEEARLSAHVTGYVQPVRLMSSDVLAGNLAGKIRELYTEIEKLRSMVFLR